MKKAAIVLASLFVCLGIGLSVILGFAIYKGVSFGEVGSMGASLVNRQVFDAGDINSLNIQYRSDSVRFERASGNEIVLEEYMSRNDPAWYAETSLKDGTLTLTQGSRQGNLVVNSWVSYSVVYLPESWQGSLHAKSSSGGLRSEVDWHFSGIYMEASSGSLRFASLTSDGTVYMKTTSGGVSANSLNAAGDISLVCSSGSLKFGDVAGSSVRAETTSGSIAMNSAAGSAIWLTSSSGSIRCEKMVGEFTAKASSGSIRLQNVSGSGNANSSSGSINVEMAEVTGDLAFTSSSGGMHITLPREAAFTFEGSTSSGSIRTDFNDSLSFNDKGNHATGTVGGTAAFHLYCKATSGSVRVNY